MFGQYTVLLQNNHKMKGMVMRSSVKVMIATAIVGCSCTVFAGGHHHHHRDGLELAAGIVNLVASVIVPPPPVIALPVNQTVVVHEPVITVPATVVVSPLPVIRYRYSAPPPRIYRSNPQRRPHHRRGHTVPVHRMQSPRR